MGTLPYQEACCFSSSSYPLNFEWGPGRGPGDLDLAGDFLRARKQSQLSRYPSNPMASGCLTQALIFSCGLLLTTIFAGDKTMLTLDPLTGFASDGTRWSLAMTPLEYAKSQVGVKEGPLGKNDGLPSTLYNRGEQTAWCASFQLWCFEKAGKALHSSVAQWYAMRAVFGASGQPPGFHDVCLARGWTFDDTPATPPMPGDLLFLSERGASDAAGGNVHAGHVGLVEMVELDKITSIDGNWSNAVMRVVRPRILPAIFGYARPWSGKQ